MDLKLYLSNDNLCNGPHFKLKNNVQGASSIHAKDRNKP